MYESAVYCMSVYTFIFNTNFDVLSTQLQNMTMYHKSDDFCLYGTLILTHHSKLLGYTEPGLYCACTESKLTHIQVYPSQQTSLHSWTTDESFHQVQC